VAELLERWFKSGKHVMPAWPEAKVTRAPADPATLPTYGSPLAQGAAAGKDQTRAHGALPTQAPAPPPGKLAQKPPAKHPPRNLLAGNILALPGTFRPNELLVQHPTKAVLDTLAAGGWERRSSVAQGVAIFVSATQDPVAVREELQRQFPGERLGLNFVYHLANDSMSGRSMGTRAGGSPCDPQRCYGRALIKWDAGLAACAAGVKIGIIDTAVDVAHSALEWKGLRVLHMPGRDAADLQPHWHGTAVASLLAGHPASGTPGLVPDAKYVIADAFTKNKAGNPETNTEHLLWALERLEEGRAQVVNMSLSGPQDPLVHQRLIELSQKGVVFVAAAGNGGAGAPSAYPAAYKDEVIAVTAVDRDQRVFEQANHGDYIDVAAPGVRIWTALPNNKEGLSSGTSFAAPFVTAMVAAIYNNAVVPAMGDARMSRRPEAVALAHLSTAKAGRDDEVGLGLVSAPSNCAAGNRRPVPTAQWETQVHFVSAQP
jgi:subtilisin family serine protease